MQPSEVVGGLSGVWAPVEGGAEARMRQQESPDQAERDPMHTDAPAGGAQRGRSRPSGNLEVGSAMTCVARARPGDVLDLAADGHTLAAGLSDGSVHVYNTSGHSLQQDGSASVSGKPVTAVTISGKRVIAAAADGVREMGGMSGKRPTMYADPKGTEVYCAAASPDGRLLAVGGEGRLLLFDPNTKELAAAFDETHKEAVSQVIWVPGRPATLISASDDGLVAVFDLAEEIDEDDSWRAALNLDGAVAMMGFYGASSAKLWMVSQLAGLHLWEWQAACSEEATGGEGTLADIQDARGPLADAAKLAASRNGRSTALVGGEGSSGLPLSFDYLLSCTYDSAGDRLLLAAGDSSGSVAVFPVHEPGNGQAAGFGPPLAWLTGIHTEVVRALVWLETPAGATATGAEDGQLCVWQPGDDSQPMDGVSEQTQAKKRRKGV